MKLKLRKIGNSYGVLLPKEKIKRFLPGGFVDIVIMETEFPPEPVEEPKVPVEEPKVPIEEPKVPVEDDFSIETKEHINQFLKSEW